MRKLFNFIALILTLAVTLTAGIYIHRLLFKPAPWLTTTSPNKTYTVEMTGDKGRGGFIMSEVRFNIIKNGQTIVKDAYAHSGDWLDISFELAYPEHAWIDENILRFYRNSDRRDDIGPDTLLITNEPGKAIRYLKLNSKDMFLVFGIQPNSTLKLLASHQGWQSWVDCEGEFEDGQPIQCSGVNFSHDDKLNEPLKYCVFIRYGRVEISSPQIEGYDVDGNWKTPNVPKAAACSRSEVRRGE